MLGRKLAMRARQTGFLKNPFCSAERTNRIRVEPQDAAKGMQYRGETRSVKRAYMDIGPGLERGAGLRSSQVLSDRARDAGAGCEGSRRPPQRGAFSAYSLSRDKEWVAAPRGRENFLSTNC